MKILILSPKNKTVFNFRGDLVKHMIASGNTVDVIGPNQEYVKDIMNLGVSKFIEVPLVKDNTNVIGDLKYCKQLKRKIKEENPDIVFSYTIKPVVYGSIAAKMAGVKRITAMVTGLGRVYTSNSLKTKIIRFVTRLLYKIAFKCCNSVIFQNNDDLNQFIEGKYLSKNKAYKVNGSGVNMDRFKRTELPKNISFLMVGRIIKEKGVLEYCKAAEIVKKEYPNIQFTLLGGFDSSIGALKREDIQYYIDNNIIDFPGEVKDPIEYYNKCSVFVLPSYYREGLPRTILEAMSCGRTIITTDWPGCREAVADEKNGFLIPIKNPNELVDKMIILINNEILLRTMGDNSFEKCMSKYSVDIVNEEMKKIIKY